MARSASITMRPRSIDFGTDLWYEGGKTDPNLALLRLDAERVEIWQDASSLVAGIKMLLGSDPKKDYRDQVAKVTLR
jgi:hypothetical protein